MVLKNKKSHRGATFLDGCRGYAYSTEDLQCPSDTGPTWKYIDGGWLDAGEGLHLNCYESTCSHESPCAWGEGDCDDDTDCAGTLVCGTGNCGSGLRGIDCCTSSCHIDSDCLNQECNTDINHCRLDSYSSDWSKCSQDSPCNEGEGDCDQHVDCKGILMCGNDNCLSGPTEMDCCTGSSIVKHE